MPPVDKRRDFLLLELGLCALIVAAPLPFGAVGPRGRLALELGALVLTLAWTVMALRRPLPLPPRGALIAVFGLLLIPAMQLVPLPRSVVGAVSPRAATLRQGLDPVPADTLSLAPQATASALRTGAALAGILLVATSVAAARGVGRIAAAALVSAVFQALYGLLVLASGHPVIWGTAKTAYLDSATGTFVNRNHFAGFLAATLPLSAGLVVARARAARERGRKRDGVVVALGPDGSRALLIALGLLVGLAGLLLSFSRAGTALGLAAVVATLAVSWKGRRAYRVAAIVLLLAIAAIPLADLGAERLAQRYQTASDDLFAPGGRWTVWGDTARTIAAFPIAGCGFGAYTWVYPVFSSPEVRLHYTHAHDDPLQLGAEGGVPALILAGLFLAALVRAVRSSATALDEPAVIGAIYGLAALALHSLVDFDFHIPADAAIAMVLAGVLLGASWNARS